MQLKSKDISKIVAEKLGEREDLVHTIHEAIFKRFARKVKNPKDKLNFYLPNVGGFYFREKRSKEMLEALLRRKEKVKNYDQDFEDHLRNILSLYEQYKQAKYEAKVAHFGKETHDNYLMAKEQRKLQIKEENQRKYRAKLLRSRNTILQESGGKS